VQVGSHRLAASEDILTKQMLATRQKLLSHPSASSLLNLRRSNQPKNGTNPMSGTASRGIKSNMSGDFSSTSTTSMSLMSSGNNSSFVSNSSSSFVSQSNSRGEKRLTASTVNFHTDSSQSTDGQSSALSSTAAGIADIMSSFNFDGSAVDFNPNYIRTMRAMRRAALEQEKQQAEQEVEQRQQQDSKPTSSSTEDSDAPLSSASMPSSSINGMAINIESKSSSALVNSPSTQTPDKIHFKPTSTSSIIGFMNQSSSSSSSDLLYHNESSHNSTSRSRLLSSSSSHNLSPHTPTHRHHPLHSPSSSSSTPMLPKSTAAHHIQSASSKSLLGSTGGSISAAHWSPSEMFPLGQSVAALKAARVPVPKPDQLSRPSHLKQQVLVLVFISVVASCYIGFQQSMALT
jgi:hypothetical protein